MGNSSSSSTTNKITQTLISQTEVNQLNMQVSEVAAKTTIETKQNCGGGSSATQIIDLSGCSAGGSINISNTSQDQSLAVKLDCQQASTIQNDIAQKMMEQMVNQIESKMSAEAQAQMDSAAKAKLEQGFLSMPGGTVNTNANNEYNLTQVNTNNVNIQNIIKHAINAELKINNIQDCINSTKAQQELNLRNCKAGQNITIDNFTQKQQVSAMTNCIQQSGVTQNIIDAVTRNTGVEVVADNDSKMQARLKADADAENKSEGLFQGISSMLSSIFGPMQTSTILSFILVAICLLTIPCLCMSSSISSTMLSATMAAGSSGPEAVARPSYSQARPSSYQRPAQTMRTTMPRRI